MKKFIQNIKGFFVKPNVVRCFFGYHEWKLGRLLKFDTPKMDSYRNRSCEIQSRKCEVCGKWDAVAS
jgi:hypothetical protein